jgi:O-antigen ligase
MLGLPFWWHLASQSKGIGKIFSFVATVPIFVSFGRAGSRSGLLALVCLFVVMFFFVNVKQKAIMCVVAVLAIAAGMAFLPDYLRVRYVTIFKQADAGQLDERDRARLGADIGSSEGREMLLRQAIQMTLEHPIFGVGPGVFGETAWDERKKNEGIGGAMLVSHNTYTQFSSETGFPGLLCFLATLFLSIKYTLSAYRRKRETDVAIARGGLYLFASLIGMSAGIFFLSVGYGMLLAVLFGLASSLHSVAQAAPANVETRDGESLAGPPQPPAQEEPEAGIRARDNFRKGRRIRFGRFATRSSRP